MQSTIIVLAAVAQLVAGHGAIIQATGDQGGSGTALGGEYFTTFWNSSNTNSTLSCRYHSS